MKKMKAFTIRIPQDLHDQIEARAVINRRTKNAEIIHILETAIDEQVARDLSLAKSGLKAG
jgi:predicted transcriptional regulator